MNKSDLIDAVAEHVGGRAAATKAVESFIDAVTRAVSAGEKVAISGFGVFEKAERAARTGRNPATGAVVKIKKTSVPKFRPGTEFKAYVKGTKKFAKVARKAVAAKAPVVRVTVTKAPAKKTVAKATPAKAPVKRVAVKAPVKKVVAKAAPAKAPVKKTVAKAPVKRATPTKTAAKAPAKKTTRGR